MEEIISIINKKKDELENECNEKDICYQKLNYVAEGLKDGAIIIKCDKDNKKEPIEILMRMYLSTMLNKDYNPSLFEETAFLDKIIHKTYSSDILDIIDCLDNILDQVSLDSLFDLFKNNKILLDFSSNTRKVNNVIELSAKIIELKSLVAVCKFPMTDVLEYMKKCDNIEDIIGTICYGGCLISCNAGNSNKDELIYVKICTEKIMKDCHKLLHNTKADITNVRKQLKAHQEIATFLEKNKNKEEIIEIPKSYKKLENDMQYQLVKSIYDHNMSYNINLQKKYLKNSQDSIRQRQQLLQKYKINSDDLFFEFEIEELENILKTLTEINISNYESIINIIKNIDLVKLETIQIQYKLGYIDSSFLSNHIGIICNDGLTYKNFVFNLRKLKGNKIPRETIINCSEVLTVDSGIISNNLGIIDTYLYKESLKNSTNINFLKSNNLKNKLDIMIELGFEDNIGEDLDLLNYSDDRYKRLIILNRLNLLSNETDEIRNILEKDKFIIPDDNIDDYLLNLPLLISDSNESISKEEFLEKLSTHQLSIRTYEIDSVKISRFKVEELLNNDDILTDKKQYEILSHGKKIDSNEYQILVNFINDKNNVNQKIKIDGKNC